MTNWSTWEPGWTEAADWVEGAGIDRIRTVADAVGVPIGDLPIEDQQSVVGLVAKSVREGSSVDSLERAMRPLLGDKQRSLSTAITLTAWAMSNASLASYKASGAKARWLADGDGCPMCLANQAAGAIAPRETFPSGHTAPPAHRDCRCAISPSIS